jgi:P-type Ca2+ transporter type 2C
MNFLFVLFISLLLAHLLGSLFSHFKLPKILGHMITGFILGFPLIKDVLFDTVTLNIFSGLSNLGIIFLLYYIGLEMNIKELIGLSKSAISISIFSAIVPFIIGYLFSIFWGLSVLQGIVIAASLAVTAEAVSAAVLSEFNLINTRIGRLILGAGMFDDLFEIFLLIFVSAVTNPGEMSGWLSIYEVLLDVIIFSLIIYFIRNYLTPILMKIMGKKPSEEDLFTVSFIIALAMAGASELLEFGTVVGALIAGVIMRVSFHNAIKNKVDEEHAIDFVKVLTFGLLEPIFFIWIGISSDITSLILNPWFGLILTIVATFGKIFGTVFSQWLMKLPLKEGYIIGLGMNPRGVVGIIAAEMARANGLINGELYAAIVFMSFATTFVSPLLLKQAISKLGKKALT